MSKVFYKTVYIAEDESICMCDNNFCKTCTKRIIGDLECIEMVVRFTPIERDHQEDLGVEFLKTLNHLDKALR